MGLWFRRLVLQALASRPDRLIAELRSARSWTAYLGSYRSLAKCIMFFFCSLWGDINLQFCANLLATPNLYPDSPETRRNRLPTGSKAILLPSMIRRGFLDSESRQDLIELARDGSAVHRLARRANALVLLDNGMSCEAIAEVLFLDDDTIRTWYQLYQEDGIEGLTSFNHEGGSCRLTVEQQDRLKAWIAETLPRTTRQVGAWIVTEFGIEYQTRSGLIALLHRLGMEHRKPKAISRKLNPAKQAAYIKGYEALLNQLSDDEVVLFMDAAHPTHAARPVGCWGPKDVAVAIEQSSGRQRLNIHGAIDLETGRTVMKDVLTVDALSTIMVLMAIEALYPSMRTIHVFLDNARYHHAKLVQAWLARPDCRIKLHFVPAYCPHLNPIERLWGLMHRHLTHNKCYPNFTDFGRAMLTFLREEVPEKWQTYCDEVTEDWRNSAEATSSRSQFVRLCVPEGHFVSSGRSGRAGDRKACQGGIELSAKRVIFCIYKT